MKESEYILTGNIAKVNIALYAMRETLSSVGLSDERRKRIISELTNAQTEMYEKVNKRVTEE